MGPKVPFYGWHPPPSQQHHYHSPSRLYSSYFCSLFQHFLSYYQHTLISNFLSVWLVFSDYSSLILQIGYHHLSPQSPQCSLASESCQYPCTNQLWVGSPRAAPFSLNHLYAYFFA
ncbi:uncharacterized protein DS421_14g451200 [Arachis hypogaea]|nr:uncharacterized protein DS421_14g451200 [Arachis hypogaea]